MSHWSQNIRKLKIEKNHFAVTMGVALVDEQLIFGTSLENGVRISLVKHGNWCKFNPRCLGSCEGVGV